MKRTVVQGQIRVRTPQTTDGVNVAFDDHDKVIYKETILPATARKHLESVNANLPTQLRSKIEDVKAETPKPPKPEIDATEKQDTKKGGGKKKAGEDAANANPGTAGTATETA